jgi:hypothetical protein
MKYGAANFALLNIRIFFFFKKINRTEYLIRNHQCNVLCLNRSGCRLIADNLPINTISNLPKQMLHCDRKLQILFDTFCLSAYKGITYLLPFSVTLIKLMSYMNIYVLFSWENNCGLEFMIFYTG